MFFKFKDLINTLDEFNKLEKKDKTLYKLFEIYENGINIIEDDGINYNYSLHPKLINLLTKNNLINLISNIQINYNSKIDIYKFCLKGNICSLSYIMEYENINLKKNINENDTEEILRFFFNIYDDLTYNEIDMIIKNKILHIKFDKEILSKNLIQFNLSHKCYLSYNNLLFLSNYLKFNLSKDDKERKLLSLLSKITKKINLFPFISNISEEYQHYKSILDKYYTNFFDILENDNCKYFESIKNPLSKYLQIEIYNIINMNNFATLNKLLSALKIEPINIFFLFSLKMSISFISLTSVIPENLEYGKSNLINLLMAFNLTIEEIKIIIEDIINLPKITYIFSASKNLLLLDGKIKERIKNYFQIKDVLLKELFKIYKNELSKFPILLNFYQLFKVKNTIINSYNTQEEIQKMYNLIRGINDYNDLYDIVRDNDILRNEIYNIYTNQN